MKMYALALSALLVGTAIAADVPAADATTKTAPVKKHKHKKAAADSTAMAVPAAAPSDTATASKKHHKKHKKAMADSSAIK
jgi:hypothetical protein